MNSNDDKKIPELVRKIIIGVPIGAMVVITIYSVIFGVAERPVDLPAVSAPSDGKLNRELKYNRTGVQKVQPEWIKYQQVAAIATGMNDPRDIAIDLRGVLHVAGDMIVARFDKAGKRLGQIELPAPPTSICIWRQGILAGSGNKLMAWQRNWPTAKIFHTFKSKSLITATAAMSDDIFAADAAGRVVYHLDGKGKVLNIIAGHGKEGFVVPSPYFDVAIGPAGQLWATNPGRQHVEAYTFSGDYEEPLSWGKGGALVRFFSGCCNPTNIAFLPNGNFVTSEKGTPRVKIYSPSGLFECVVAGDDDFDPDTAGLALAADSEGRVYVLDPKRKTVRIYARKKP